MKSVNLCPLPKISQPPVSGILVTLVHSGLQHGRSDIINLAVLVLLALAVVPVLDRTVVAGDTAVNLGLLAALRTGEMLTGNITVVGTDRVGGGHGVVGQLEVLSDLANQGGGSLPVRQLLAQEGMEHGTGGVAGLQLVLDLQSGEDILREAHRQVGGVGVVGLTYEESNRT